MGWTCGKNGRQMMGQNNNSMIPKGLQKSKRKSKEKKEG